MPRAVPRARSRSRSRVAHRRGASAVRKERLAKVASMNDESKAEKETTLVGEAVLTPMGQVLEDPRPRHKLELAELNKKLDALKKERELYGKNPEEKAFRKELTAQMAQLQDEYRSRWAREAAEYTQYLSESQQTSDPLRVDKLNRIREKKSYLASHPDAPLGMLAYK